MTAYSKYDFDYNYVSSALTSDRKVMPFKFHYEYGVVRELSLAIYRKLLESYDIKPDDKIVIVGAAYGWGAEVLSELSGATSIHLTDPSPHIHHTSHHTCGSDVDRWAVDALGFEGVSALDLKNVYPYYDKVKSTKKIHCNYFVTEEDLELAVKDLGGFPDLVITEVCLETMTSAEIDARNEFKDLLSGKGCRFLDIVYRHGEFYNQFTGNPTYDSMRAEVIS